MSGKVKEELNAEEDASECLDEKTDIKYQDIQEIKLKEENIGGS